MSKIKPWVVLALCQHLAGHVQSMTIDLALAPPQALPSYKDVSQMYLKLDLGRPDHLHFVLNHYINEVKLSLSNLNHFLDQTSSDLFFDSGDPGE